MKAIQKWQAEDGTEFPAPEAALAHDLLCAECADLTAKLRAVPQTLEFSNGEVYVQQDKAVVLEVQRATSKIARRYFGRVNALAFEFAEHAEKPAGLSTIGRMICDGCPGPVRGVWNRVMCTDAWFREWGQPFYAKNPRHGGRPA